MRTSSTHDVYFGEHWRTLALITIFFSAFAGGGFDSALLAMAPLALALVLFIGFVWLTSKNPGFLRGSGTVLLGEDGFSADWGEEKNGPLLDGPIAQALDSTKGERRFTPWTAVTSIERPVFRRDPQSRIILHTATASLVLEAGSLENANVLEEELQDRLRRDRARPRLAKEEVPSSVLHSVSEAKRTPTPPSDILARVAQDSSLERKVRVQAAHIAASSGDSLVLEALRDTTADEQLLSVLSD